MTLSSLGIAGIWPMLFHQLHIEAVVEARGYRCPVICMPEELMEE
jgi:hypothetical protein